eukprot:GHVU01122497.1.p2 GENE.GHVU01122497.1~~GHVU01122497.1.p2  ORF type:complete len:104 (-),score=5.61 GHVU01122497.1:93-404(-)
MCIYISFIDYYRCCNRSKTSVAAIDYRSIASFLPSSIHALHSFFHPSIHSLIIQQLNRGACVHAMRFHERAMHTFVHQVVREYVHTPIRQQDTHSYATTITNE